MAKSRGTNSRALAHLMIHGEEIQVLATQNINRGYVLVKIRKPSELKGFLLVDESCFLEGEPEKVKELKAGKVLCL